MNTSSAEHTRQPAAVEMAEVEVVDASDEGVSPPASLDNTDTALTVDEMLDLHVGRAPYKREGSRSQPHLRCLRRVSRRLFPVAGSPPIWQDRTVALKYPTTSCPLQHGSQLSF